MSGIRQHLVISTVVLELRNKKSVASLILDVLENKQVSCI